MWPPDTSRIAVCLRSWPQHSCPQQPHLGVARGATGVCSRGAAKPGHRHQPQQQRTAAALWPSQATRLSDKAVAAGCRGSGMAWHGGLTHDGAQVLRLGRHCSTGTAWAQHGHIKTKKSSGFIAPCQMNVTSHHIPARPGWAGQDPSQLEQSHAPTWGGGVVAAQLAELLERVDSHARGLGLLHTMTGQGQGSRGRAAGKVSSRHAGHSDKGGSTQQCSKGGARGGASPRRLPHPPCPSTPRS